MYVLFSSSVTLLRLLRPLSSYVDVCTFFLLLLMLLFVFCFCFSCLVYVFLTQRKNAHHLRLRWLISLTRFSLLTRINLRVYVQYVFIRIFIFFLFLSSAVLLFGFYFSTIFFSMHIQFFSFICLIFIGSFFSSSLNVGLFVMHRHTFNQTHELE